MITHTYIHTFLYLQMTGYTLDSSAHGSLTGLQIRYQHISKGLEHLISTVELY